MADGMTAAVFAISAILGYAAWWLVRHERAVRRFRAGVEPSRRVGRR
jgi:hypothetical protein